MQHAESGNGDRVDAPVVRVAAPNAPAPASDLDRLKDILLGDELGALDALDARVEKVEREQSELPARLPGAIESARAGRHGADGARAGQAGHACARHGRAREPPGHRRRAVPGHRPRDPQGDRRGAAQSRRRRQRRDRIELHAARPALALRSVAQRCAVRADRDQAHAELRHRSCVPDRARFGPRARSRIGAASARARRRRDRRHADGDRRVRARFGRRDGGGTLDSARVGEHLLWVVHGPRANLACFHPRRPAAAPACAARTAPRSDPCGLRRGRAQRRRCIARVAASRSADVRSARGGSIGRAVGVAVADADRVAGRARAARLDDRAQRARQRVGRERACAIGVASWLRADRHRTARPRCVDRARPVRSRRRARCDRARRRRTTRDARYGRLRVDRRCDRRAPRAASACGAAERDDRSRWRRACARRARRGGMGRYGARTCRVGPGRSPRGFFGRERER